MGFVLLGVLLTLSPTAPVGWRVVTVPPWEQRLVLGVAGVRVRVVTVAMRRGGLVTVTLQIWTAVLVETLQLGSRVLIGDGGQSFLLEGPVRLTETVLSLVEGAELRGAAGCRR